MAFNPGIDNEEEDNNAQSGTDQLGGQSGVITGATATEGAAKKGKGSGFTNIGSYLDANKQDIPGMTDQAVGKVGDQYNKATTSVRASQDAFNSQADQNRGAYVQGANTAEEARKAIADNLRNDNEIDENDRNTWASYANSQYKGPQELDNNYQPEASTAKDWSNTLASSTGYFPMMGKLFSDGRSDYNSGMQRLDGSLISADKDSRQKFNDFNQTASAGLDSTVSEAQQQASQKASQYQQQADWTKQAARDALEQDVLPEYMKGLTGQVAQTNAQRQAEYEAARAGGPLSYSMMIDNPQTAQQSAEYTQAEKRIKDRYDILAAQYPEMKKRGQEVMAADLARLQELAYSPVAQREVKVSGPDKANYTTYGGDVGLGSLDPTATAKLQALYGMSGNADLQNSLEAEAASKLGFNDIMRGGSSNPYSFDQSGFEQAKNAAQLAETQKVLDWEAQIKATKIAQQQQFLNDYINGAATKY